jgi:RNA polymerase sigma-70 factor, ECF subfamily
VEGLEELLAKDAVLYADGGGKALAAPEPLFGAAVIARFMAGVARVRRAFGEFETELVRVNGQPGRVLRSRGAEQYGEAERRAVEKAQALLKSGGDAESLAALVSQELADRARSIRAESGDNDGPLRVWDVLTVDVVDGRIQTVRIVRNPDKLAHL